jgi:hypothetical protein
MMERCMRESPLMAVLSAQLENRPHQAHKKAAPHHQDGKLNEDVLNPS